MRRPLNPLSSVSRLLPTAALLVAGLLPAQARGPASDGWSERELAAAAKLLDQAVFDDLKAHGLKPTPGIDDKIFLRRAYLRIAGRIPTADETAAFLGTRRSGKRAELVDELLNSRAHVARMVPFWIDLLRAKDRLATRTSGLPLQDFLRDAVTQNLRFDELARQLLTATGPAHARDNGATGYLLRDLGMPHDNMANTARVFLGTRIECAQCHNHPFDDTWLQRDFYALAAMQGNLRYTDTSVYRTDAGKRLLAAGRDLREQYGQAGTRALRRMVQGLTVGISGGGSGVEQLPADYQYEDAAAGATIPAHVPFGQTPDLQQPRRMSRREATALGLRGSAAHNAWTDVGSRAAFANWVTDPDNPRFAAVIAARMWELAMGVGPLEPVDDLREDTEIPNPALWAALADTMRAVDFDLRLFQRIVYRTRLFQRTAVAAPAPGSGPFRFTGPAIERLSAEQFWDSLVTLAVADVDATIEPLGAHAERVYRSYEEMLSLGPDQLRERLEREALRYSDADAYRKLIARERAQARREAQEITAAERDQLRDKAGPLLEELRKARRRKDQQAIAALTRQLGQLRDELGAARTGAAAPPPRRGLVRASELPSPAPDDHLLRAYGQSDRETTLGGHRDATVPQALMLLNGFADRELCVPTSAVMTRLLDLDSADDRLEAAFVTILQRQPNRDERRVWRQDLADGAEPALADLVWTLVNSHEFRFVR